MSSMAPHMWKTACHVVLPRRLMLPETLRQFKLTFQRIPQRRPREDRSTPQ
jgi:hypothetical protein